MFYMLSKVFKMTIQITVMVIVGVIFGFIAGVIMASKSQKEVECLGNVHIDRSADEPYMFLEIATASDFDKICASEYANFKVINENYVK